MGSHGDKRNPWAQLSSKLFNVETAARPVTMKKQQRFRGLGRCADPDRYLRPRGLFLAQPLDKRSDRGAFEQQAIGQRLAGELPQFEHQLRRQERIASHVEEIIFDRKVWRLQEPDADPEYFRAQLVWRVDKQFASHLNPSTRR